MRSKRKRAPGDVNGSPYMDASQAAEALRISLPTLYAYVSRGLIRSEIDSAKRRTRRYHAEDVARLKARNEARHDPGGAARRTLAWGMPVLDSAITLIADGRLYYRGRDAVELALTRSLEEVSGLIWRGRLDADLGDFFSDSQRRWLRGLTGWPPLCAVSPIEAFQALLPLAAAQDPLALDLRREAVARTGARILKLLAMTVARRAGRDLSIARMLQDQWVPHDERAAAILSAALVLCADHELNVSSFTARCVASTAATPYDVVAAGLAALKGGKHGGATARVDAFLHEIGRAENVRRVVADRLRRAEPLAGFGQPLYPHGDPRARALLELLADRYPRSRALALSDAVAAEVRRVSGEEPNLDFGLTAVARTVGLPAGSPLVLFALGRTVGWIGHAIEQYEINRLIRPRARYVGPLPIGAEVGK